MTRYPSTLGSWLVGEFRAIGVTLLAAVSLGFVAAPCAALAEALQSSGLEEIGQQVSDSELSQMRGKFMTSNSVAYFGVQMTTIWEGPDGITTVANLLFTLNFSGAQPTSQVLVGFTRQGDPAMDVATAGGAPDTSPGTSTGALQSTLIAGNDNNALNSMTISVAPVAQLNQAVPPGLAPASGSETHTFANGDSLHFVLTSTGIGLMMGNGPSSATQMISGDVGRATQTISLMNNNSNVLNNMTMTVGLGPSQNMPTPQAVQAVLNHATLGF